MIEAVIFMRWLLYLSPNLVRPATKNLPGINPGRHNLVKHPSAIYEASRLDLMRRMWSRE